MYFHVFMKSYIYVEYLVGACGSMAVDLNGFSSRSHIIAEDPIFTDCVQ